MNPIKKAVSGRGALALAAALAFGVGFSLWGTAGVQAGPGGELVVADFNTGDKPNNLGGDFGTWDANPNDDTQEVKMAFVEDDAAGDKYGYAVRLDYDVDSPNPAYNGLWMKLAGQDGTAFNTLNFWVKGDKDKGFSPRVKVELKDSSNKPSPYIVSGITGEWQKFSIPFEKFRKVEDWKSLNEFVVVFDDVNSNPKTGAIIIDNVTLTKE